MKTVFLRVLEADDKASALRAAIRDPEAARPQQRFNVDPADFAAVPRSPFAYWVSEGLRSLFKEMSSFETEERTAKRGPSTCDDFRYVRCWWAVNTAISHCHGVWKSFAKGGKFSPYYSDVHLEVDWEARRRTFLGFFGRPGREIERPESLEFFFRSGLTWPRRTTSGISLRVMPPGCIFADKGPAAFVENDESDDLLANLAVANSRVFAACVELQLAAADAAARSYEVGVIQRTPVPSLDPADKTALATLARRAWSLKRTLDTRTETSHAFTLPALLQVEDGTIAERADAWAEHVDKIDAELAAIQAEIDERCFELYGIDEADRRAITEGFGGEGADADDEAEEEADDGAEADIGADLPRLAAELVSWAVGVAFGRFDVRLATGERTLPDEPEPFDPLPVCSPAMLTGDDGLPLASAPEGYPFDVPENGVLVDDPGHQRDLVAAVRAVFEAVFGASADSWWNEVAAVLDPKGHDPRGWLASGFFEHHLKAHSKSRRKAPIVWQLSTSSGRYNLSLYAHRLTRDSFFQLQDDVVAPKVAHEERRLASLAQSAGGSPTASQRKEIAEQEAFVVELRALLDEVKRVAPLWSPNLDDGVVLTMAPLWRLVPRHRPWQKELASRWRKLVASDYDWAHLAMHLCPERVVPRCVEDRSLAIAHGLEEELWQEDADGKWRPRDVDDATVGKIVEDRASAAVEAALRSLLDAPQPSQAGPSRRKGRPRKS